MKKPVTRRNFLSSTGTVALAAASITALGAEQSASKPLKILGVSCSPRRGMTTATSVQTALEAAKAVDQRITIELMDLGGMNVAPWSPNPPADDMATLLPKFQDPALGGLIIGSPCYFRSLSGLAKCFLERLAPLREPEMVLANKPFGVLAVGGFRNGGQEMTIEQVQAILLCYEMVPVGGHAPAFQGGTLVSTDGLVSEDALGLRTAQRVGQRVGEMALRL